MVRKISYRKRIVDILQIERVVYGKELKRRIGFRYGSTAVYVANRMIERGELVSSPLYKVAPDVEVKFFWLPGTDDYTVKRTSPFFYCSRKIWTSVSG